MNHLQTLRFPVGCIRKTTSFLATIGLVAASLGAAETMYARVGQSLALLDRAGYHDVWQWENRALLRAYRWLYEQADYPAAGDDTWQLPLVDRFYGTSYWNGGPTSPGKNVGWTDWTHWTCSTLFPLLRACRQADELAVGQVEGVYSGEEKLSEDFLVRRAAGNGVELIGTEYFFA